jgi:hypothetical protein
MNKLSLSLLWLLILLVGFSLGNAQDRKSRATKEFMRDKLENSQKILEGLALEDFNLISAKARKLSAMSQEASWQVFDNPDYVQYSAEFRKAVDGLARASERKNIDAATLAYVKVTMSCVECHKFVRGKLVAGNHKSLETGALLGLASLSRTID